MKVLIVDDMHECILQILDEAGIEVIYKPEITVNEMIVQLQEVEGLVIRSKVFVDEKILSHAHKIKFVARAGAGTDNLDHDYLNSREIIILNAPEGNRNAVGDHALGLMLNLTNNILKSHKEIEKGIWDREGNRGFELSELTIGIVGYGNTGQAVARRLSGFDTRVLAYDKYRNNYGDEFAEESAFEEICSQADLVSFHIPLTYETKFLINDDFLDKFKKSIYLINTSRGEIADHEALIKGLKNNKIRGLGLDVLENEKLNTLSDNQKERFNFLINNPNTIITPHVAGWSKASYRKISEVIAHKILSIV